MPLYAYRATDEEGRPVEGRMEADTAAEAVAHIQDRRLRVSSVDDVEPTRIASTGQPLSWTDIDMLNRQLLSIVKSGMPLSASLREMASDIPSRRLRHVLNDVQQSLESGMSIDDAFERHAGKLPPIYLSMIRAGEKSGNLAGVLQMLTQDSGDALDARGRFWRLATYPLIVLAVTIAVIVFQCIYVVPTFREVINDFDSLVPWTTQLLFNLSDLIVNHTILFFVIVGVLIALAFAAATLVRRSIPIAKFWDRTKLYLPGFGRLYRSEMIARFSRSLSLMLKAGVPLVESIDLASAASGNHALRKAGMDAATRVAQGMPVSDALEGTGYFSHTFNWLMGNAEQRGDIVETLDGIADMYGREASNREHLLAIAAGPVLVLIVGFIVGSVFTALYQPLFSISSALSG